MLETYTLFKFLHVAAVIIWIGGVCTLTILTARLARRQDRAALIALGRESRVFGSVVIGPAAGLTLVAGMGTAASAGLDFSTLWITWGFIGIVGSLLLGAVFIRRAAGELNALAAVAATEEQRLGAARRRLTMLNALNLLLLLSVVWAMVSKPTF